MAGSEFGFAIFFLSEIRELCCDQKFGEDMSVVRASPPKSHEPASFYRVDLRYRFRYKFGARIDGLISSGQQSGEVTRFLQSHAVGSV